MKARLAGGCFIAATICALSQAAGAAGSAAATRPAVDVIPGTAIRIEMVRLPPGKVEIQEEGAGSAKDLPMKAFWISRTEVTWDAYEVWSSLLDLSNEERDRLVLDEDSLPKHAKSRPSAPYADPGCGFGREGYPAISIHPHAAQQFCAWLSKKAGRRYRLATEAEWEYACAPPRPVDGSVLERVAWYAANSRNEVDDLVTHPVGRKAPNRWGLYDMLGNAAEWVIRADGKPVLKGGSYKHRASMIRAAGGIPFDEAVHQMTDPEDPKSAWWLRDGPFAGFRIVREE